MATVTKGYTFGATETVTSAKLATLVDSAAVGNIVSADISSNAITDIKINDVSGAKFTSLSAIPGAAGGVPIANGGTGQTTITQGDILYGSGTNTISKLAAGTAGQALTTGGAGANPAFGGMTTQGDIEYHNGTTRTRLAPSTSGLVLKTKGAAANPAWEAAGFVSWTTGLSVMTNYQAATDIIVIATASFDATAVGSAKLEGLSDAGTPPSVRRAYLENPTTAGGYYMSIIFPVRKNDYWRVTNANVSNQTVQFMAVGS